MIGRPKLWIDMTSEETLSLLKEIGFPKEENEIPQEMTINWIMSEFDLFIQILAEKGQFYFEIVYRKRDETLNYSKEYYPSPALAKNAAIQAACKWIKIRYLK